MVELGNTTGEGRFQRLRAWLVRHGPDFSNPSVQRAGLVFMVAVGIPIGVGGFTFHYAKGTSYLTSDPKACVNCHIMRDQFASWERSSHHAVARCVDCHLPHDLAGKWIAKAENGYHHSKAFTLQNFHDPIFIKPKNSAILEENCMRCHGDIAGSMMGVLDAAPGTRGCVRCHGSTGHAANQL